MSKPLAGSGATGQSKSLYQALAVPMLQHILFQSTPHCRSVPVRKNENVTPTEYHNFIDAEKAINQPQQIYPWIWLSLAQNMTSSH